jgi:DNA-binding transcriptional LysR family regulator
MDLKLLRCFNIVADELHFGRAAQQLDMLPSALGRNIRILEESLGVRLFNRSTRSVELTRSGRALLESSHEMMAAFDTEMQRVRDASSLDDRVFRIGAIDSASTGLLPQLVHDFRDLEPDLELVLVEEKTVKMLPRLIAGNLDLAFVRPPTVARPEFEFHHLMHEATVIALPADHRLANKKTIQIDDLRDVPLIVPSPRNRPHSYKLTMDVFQREGLKPKIAQTADEKHTIVRLVATGLGAALVPQWTNRIQVDGVVYRKLRTESGEEIRELPLAAAWVRGSKDAVRDRIVGLVRSRLEKYDT